LGEEKSEKKKGKHKWKNERILKKKQKKNQGGKRGRPAPLHVAFRTPESKSDGTSQTTKNGPPSPTKTTLCGRSKLNADRAGKLLGVRLFLQKVIRDTNNDRFSDKYCASRLKSN